MMTLKVTIRPLSQDAQDIDIIAKEEHHHD